MTPEDFEMAHNFFKTPKPSNSEAPSAKLLEKIRKAQIPGLEILNDVDMTIGKASFPKTPAQVPARAPLSKQHKPKF